VKEILSFKKLDEKEKDWELLNTNKKIEKLYDMILEIQKQLVFHITIDTPDM